MLFSFQVSDVITDRNVNNATCDHRRNGHVATRSEYKIGRYVRVDFHLENQIGRG